MNGKSIGLRRHALPQSIAASRRWALRAICAAAAVYFGCEKRPAAPTKPPTPAVIPAKSKAESPSDVRPQEAAAPAKPSPERIAVLTPGGPVLIDATLTLDGRPFDEPFNRQLQATLAAADSNGDGAATWKELLANDAFLSAANASGQPPTAQLKRQWTEQFDFNDDGYLQRREAAAWMGRDAGQSATAFALRSTRAYLPDPRATSRIWPFLDQDDDGKLSASELGTASETLLKLDADDDQVLTVEELVSLGEQLAGPSSRMTPAVDSSRDGAIHLQPGHAIERLEYVLPDLYSPRQPLSPRSFLDLPGLFAQLDASEDGLLVRDELANLLSVEPHVRLAIDFSAPAASEGRPLAMLRLDQRAEPLRASEQSPTRIVLALGSTRLAISAHDMAPPRSCSSDGSSNDGLQSDGSTNGRSLTGGDQLRLMVHDQLDALFDEIDANGDGRLGEREMSCCGALLLKRDADGDGALTTTELPYSMIVAFLRGEPPAERSFYVPAADERRADETSALEWFRLADFNVDGDVSRREFLGSAARFAELDANGDGFIVPAEAAAHSSDEQ